MLIVTIVTVCLCVIIVSASLYYVFRYKKKIQNQTMRRNHRLSTFSIFRQSFYPATETIEEPKQETLHLRKGSSNFSSEDATMIANSYRETLAQSSRRSIDSVVSIEPQLSRRDTIIKLVPSPVQ
jgi:hypothetical protein